MYYNKIKEFRDYIKNADDNHIEKIVDFINISGFFYGSDYGYYGDDSKLLEDAIRYAESCVNDVKTHLIEIGYMSEDY